MVVREYRSDQGAHYISSNEGIPKSGVAYMGINLGCRDTGMPKKPLDEPNIDSSLQQEGSRSMPKHMRSDAI